MWHSLHVGLDRFGRSLFLSFDSLTRQIGRKTFDCGGTEGLGDGLLATASATAASTTPTTSASALAFLPRGRRPRLLMRVGGLFASGLRFKLGLGGGGNLGLWMARFEIS